MAIESNTQRPARDAVLVWLVALCATVVVGWPFAMGEAFFSPNTGRTVALRALEWPDPRLVAVALAITCMFWFTPIALQVHKNWAGVVRGFAYVMHAPALFFALHFLGHFLKDLASAFGSFGVTPAQTLHGLYVIGVLSALILLERCLLASGARFSAPSLQAMRATLLLIGSCLLVTLASAALRSWGNGLAVPVEPFDRQRWLSAPAIDPGPQQPQRALCPRGGMAANLVLSKQFQDQPRSVVEAQLGRPQDFYSGTARYELGVCTRAFWPRTELVVNYREQKLRSAYLQAYSL